ncbi:MAG: hypothetical protein IJ026_04000, partial [Candidatus Methanomethylophilaceae archaeon]|nr:hypothetical protein [Candidatus Methanomethylophilaceae archaeon]
MSGYLRAEPSGRSHMLSLPNGEMCTLFGEMVSRYLERRCGDSDILRMIMDLTDAILVDDVPVIGRSLSELFHSSLGYMMLDSEHVYQAFIAAILLNLSRRYDILLESKVPGPPHVVIELKRSDSDAGDDRVLSDARRALEQISKKGYTTGLRGNVLMYGIAFRGKEPTIVSDTTTLL